VKITAPYRLYGLGTGMLVALSVCARSFSDRGGPQFMASLTIAGVLYLVAIRELFATPRFPMSVVAIGLVIAAVWNIEFLRLPAGVDDDIHRYVWDGRLQRLGYNPYVVIPSDPAVKGLHTAETRNLNNPDLPSPYPAGAQLFFSSSDCHP
jgi:alpha-1,6-mannosyltransferase